MDSATIVAFAAASTVLLVVPGPAVTFVIARSLQGGRTIGLASVIGLHLGTAVHIAAAVVGLSAILVSSAAAFTALRWAGAAYLIYLGIRSILNNQAEAAEAASAAGPNATAALREGVVVNVLNPKLAIFFLAYLPLFTNPGAGSVTVQLLLLGGLFILIGLVTDGIYAVGAAALRSRFRPDSPLMQNRNRIAGITYIGLGALAFALPGRGST